MSDQYDLLIVGGGMVGATLGCSLGGSHLRVALIEDSPPSPFAPEQTHDLRVSALSVASASILKTIGAWQGITKRRYCPFRRMRVWEDTEGVEFRSEEIDEPVLGYIVENRVIQLALLDRLEQFTNIHLITSIKAKSIDYTPSESRIELENGRTLTGRLLIAADGGHSKVRQIAGMGVSSRDYEQHALVLTVDTADGQQDITWQRFTPNGPLAFLPLDGPHASLVWYEQPERVKALRNLSEQTLLEELIRTFPPCLGEIKGITAVGSFPLRRQQALKYAKEGIALIGDAAHMIHPLAGQGVNIGLLDAAALAQVLIAGHAKRQDIGAIKVLQHYEKSCQNNNLIMMTTMDLFYRMFGNANPPLKLLRNVGLELAERMIPAKKMVMRYAMGLGSSLPKLARGEAILG